MYLNYARCVGYKSQSGERSSSLWSLVAFLSPSRPSVVSFGVSRLVFGLLGIFYQRWDDRCRDAQRRFPVWCIMASSLRFMEQLCRRRVGRRRDAWCQDASIVTYGVS
jgi:hypothetical protein